MAAVLLILTTGCITTPGYNPYGDLYEDIYKDSSVYKKHQNTINNIDKEQQIKYVAWVTMLKTSNTKKATKR